VRSTSVSSSNRRGIARARARHWRRASSIVVATTGRDFNYTDGASERARATTNDAGRRGRHARAVRRASRREMRRSTRARRRWLTKVTLRQFRCDVSTHRGDGPNDAGANRDGGARARRRRVARSSRARVETRGDPRTSVERVEEKE
jgi:hypothetical protein